MIFYCQKNYPQSLGTSNLSISDYGCALIGVSMLAGADPLIVNNLLISQGGYIDGNIMDWPKAAEILGLDYNPETDKALQYPLIAETNYYANSGFPQHFFVLLDPETMTIADPLTGKIGINIYNIVKYINISPKNQIGGKMYADVGVAVESLGQEVITSSENYTVARQVPSDGYAEITSVGAYGSHFDQGWTGTITATPDLPSGRTSDNQWYHIEYGTVSGWIKAEYLKVPVATSTVDPNSNLQQKINKAIADLQ